MLLSSLDGSPSRAHDWLRKSRSLRESDGGGRELERRIPFAACFDETCCQSADAERVREPLAASRLVNRTPELAAFAVGADASLLASPRRCVARPFSVFRPKECRKVLVVVRHGESEHNALSKSGRGWADPHVYDPHLTSVGCQQAVALRGRLLRELRTNPHLSCHAPESMLWLSSPLQRSLETLLLACPALPPFRLSGNHTFRGAHLQSELARAFPDDASHAAARRSIKVTPCIAERLCTRGDIGSPASVLRSRFKALEGCLDLAQERWWFGEQENCRERDTFQRKESTLEFKCRIDEARRFISCQPQQVIVLVGHSVFWKHFFGLDSSLGNCEYKVLHW